MRALADRGRQGYDGGAAGGLRWPFRASTAPFRARPISSGTNHGAAAAGALRGFGIDISKRELVRLLTTGHDSFHEEAREVLRAGLASAAWITVDDTGARHKANNGFCTQIGNAHFTAFATTTSKSRLNFLSLLRAGHGDYVVNDAALAYMRGRALAAHGLSRA